MTAKEFIETLKNAGFVCFTSDTKEEISYFYFSKDNKIGYCQLSYGFTEIFDFHTVHVPCSECGTGFQIAKDVEPSIELAEQSFMYAPAWHYGIVTKYKSVEDFKKHMGKILEYHDL